VEEARPIEVTDQSFQQEVLEAKVPVVLDFWAPWCMPCRTVTPVMDSLAKHYQGKVKVCKINIEQGQQSASRYGVMSVPTLHIFKDGQIVEQLTKVTSNLEEDIKKKVAAYI